MIGGFMNHFKTKRGASYWYRIYHYTCPACGIEKIVKKRERFAPKPKNKEDQHIYIENYDYCTEELNL